MKTKVLRTGVVLFVAAIPLAGAGPATATTTHSRSAQARPDSSCYPNREYVVIPGAFSNAASGGQGTGEAEVSLPNDVTNPTAHSSWNVRMSVTGNQGAYGDYSPGSISGALRLVINLPSGTVIFTSRCIAEAQNEGRPTDEVGVSGAMEGEFEGQVTGFPGSPDATPAVGSISLNKTGPGAITYNLGIELGTTCNESSSEINAGGDGHGSFADPGTFGYRAGAPQSADPTCGPNQQQQAQ